MSTMYNVPIMVRTQIYLTENEREALGSISEETGRTQSDLIREAVDRFVDDFRNDHRSKWLEKGFGLWSGREDVPDVAALRREWDR